MLAPDHRFIFDSPGNRASRPIARDAFVRNGEFPSEIFAKAPHPPHYFAIISA